jgi:hypothetical protein
MKSHFPIKKVITVHLLNLEKSIWFMLEVIDSINLLIHYTLKKIMYEQVKE